MKKLGGVHCKEAIAMLFIPTTTQSMYKWCFANAGANMTILKK